MEFLTLAKKRFSVVNYEQRPVEQDKIDRIMEAALAAPTACNFQPERILIISDEAGREKLNRAVPSGYYAPLAFLVCYDKTACWTRPMDGKNSGDIDASIVATHMMMEMTDLGLGSIWIMYWDPDKVRTVFDLAQNIEPVALLVAGYPAADATPRKGHLESKKKEEILL